MFEAWTADDEVALLAYSKNVDTVGLLEFVTNNLDKIDWSNNDFAFLRVFIGKLFMSFISDFDKGNYAACINQIFDNTKVDIPLLLKAIKKNINPGAYLEELLKVRPEIQVYNELDDNFGVFENDEPAWNPSQSQLNNLIMKTSMNKANYWQQQLEEMRKMFDWSTKNYMALFSLMDDYQDQLNRIDHFTGGLEKANSEDSIERLKLTIAESKQKADFYRKYLDAVFAELDAGEVFTAYAEEFKKDWVGLDKTFALFPQFDNLLGLRTKFDIFESTTMTYDQMYGDETDANKLALLMTLYYDIDRYIEHVYQRGDEIDWADSEYMFVRFLLVLINSEYEKIRSISSAEELSSDFHQKAEDCLKHIFANYDVDVIGLVKTIFEALTHNPKQKDILEILARIHPEAKPYIDTNSEFDFL